MRFVIHALAFILLCPALPAFAQDYKTLLDIPEGAALVNLSATERLEVDQDLLAATLYFEAQNKDPKALQDEINSVMKKALDATKTAGEVKTSTGQYYVYPYDYDPTPQPIKKGDLREPLVRVWRGSQEIMLKSKNAEQLLGLTGKLQEMGLSMRGLGYTISPDLLEETQNSMLEAALKKLQTKADRTAKALGKSKANLLQVNVDTGGYYPQPMMLARNDAIPTGLSKEMAAPVAQAGQSEITMTVSAQALIKP